MSTHAQWGVVLPRQERKECAGFSKAKVAAVLVRTACVGGLWSERVSAATIQCVGSSVMQSASHIMKVFLTRRIPQEGMKILSSAGVYG